MYWRHKIFCALSSYSGHEGGKFDVEYALWMMKQLDMMLSQLFHASSCILSMKEVILMQNMRPLYMLNHYDFPFKCLQSWIE